MNPVTLAILAALLLSPAVRADDDRRAVRQIGLLSSVPDALRLQVDMPASELFIENGPPGVIEISGTVERKFRREKDRDRAQQIANATSVKVQLQGSRAFLRRDFGPEARGRSARSGDTEFRLRLKVPVGMHVEVQQRAGDVRMAGRFGDIDINMRAGAVDLRIPKAPVRELYADVKVGEVKTNLGDRIIEKEGILAGRTTYRNDAGAHRVSVALLAGEVHIELTP
jgi:hypothetical protein